MLGQDFVILGFIHPYGLCMALGILACFGFLMFTMTKKNFNEESTDKLLLFGIVATGLGIFVAAIVQGIYNVLAGGKFDLKSMTFLGGLIGGVSGFLILWNLYIFVVAPRTKIKLLSTENMNATLTDALPFVPPSITIAHALGRLGCTFAGCCHGAKTDAWYGIYMHTATFGYAKVVPTQLFECIFLLLLSVVMIVLFYKFKFNYNFTVYMIAYGIWRFLIEFIRADYRGGVDSPLSPSQWLSLVMVPLGIAYIFVQKHVFAKMMKHPELQPPVNQKKVKAAAGEVVTEEVAPEETIVDSQEADLPEENTSNE